MLSFLNQSPQGTLDQLVRQGYLPNRGSSASLGQGFGSSAALRGLDSQAGLLSQQVKHSASMQTFKRTLANYILFD